MAQHIAWGSIELLHNVVRTLNYLTDLGQQPLPVMRYRAKVKLHGTNMGIQITGEGLVAQSRTGLLTPQSDLKGFAKWVHGPARRFFESLPEDHTVFGEWAGPGVERGMAVSTLPHKVFAVFAIQQGIGESARVIYDPAGIETFLGPRNLEGLYVLPWEGPEVVLDFSDRADLEAKAAFVNGLVEQVEREDPWVKGTFNVSGLGEGLVFYPVGGNAPTAPEALAPMMWKAKGEKHRTAGTKQAVQVSAEVVQSVGDFVTLMVTEARLNQGVSALNGECNMRLMGDFLRWVVEDTKKESVAELEAAGLTWDQAQRAVQERARDWFKSQIR